MKDFIERPLPVVEAAEKQKGLNWFLEILVFVLVFVVSSFALVIVMMPGEIIMLSTNQIYQEAVASGNASEIMEASAQIVETDAYMILSLFADIAMIAVVCLFCKLIQKRGLRTIGFRREHVCREYLIGALTGFLFFSAAVLLGVLTGGLKITGISPQFSIGIFVLYLLGFMIQGMAEEVLCRGYMMVSIGRRYPMYVAVLTNALFFAALHLMNNGITVLAFINLALFGIFASLYFIRRGNIWGIGAFHSIWNLVQGNFYGIRVSGMPMGNSLFETVAQEGKDLFNGGAFGLEGSIWVTVVLAAGIVFLYIRKNQKEKEDMLPKYAYMIEPGEPIETTEEIIKEINMYFNNQQKNVSVIEQEPLPIVSVDGKCYVARTDRFVGLLGGGREVDKPYPIKYYGGGPGNIAGYKFIYLYPYEEKSHE